MRIIIYTIMKKEGRFVSWFQSMLLYLFFSFLFNSVQGQGRLVIYNDAYIVLKDNVFVVVSNPSSTAIVTSGTGGNIVSENESSILKWNIGSNTGTYMVPFTTKPVVQGGNGTKIPVTLDLTSAGDLNGSIKMSTYETSTDLNLPWATGITHMNNSLGIDNSLKVVDRFWILNSETYVSPPSALVALTYDDNVNEIGGGNAITESNLQAQRFDETNNIWGGSLATFGTVNIVSNVVSNINIPSVDFHKIWTLTDNSSPLPIDLNEYYGNCDDGILDFTWGTSAEINNERFIIEYSADFVTWHIILQKDGQGTSTVTSLYNEKVLIENERGYYRLSQVDYNGEKTEYPAIYIACKSSTSPGISLFPNPSNGEFNVSFHSFKGKELQLFLYDARGKILLDQNLNVDSSVYTKSYNFNNLDAGTYCFVVFDFKDQTFYTEKMIIY